MRVNKQLTIMQLWCIPIWAARACLSSSSSSYQWHILGTDMNNRITTWPIFGWVAIIRITMVYYIPYHNHSHALQWLCSWWWYWSRSLELDPHKRPSASSLVDHPFLVKYRGRGVPTDFAHLSAISSSSSSSSASSSASSSLSSADRSSRTATNNINNGSSSRDNRNDVNKVIDFLLHHHATRSSSSSSPSSVWTLPDDQLK